MSWSDIDWGNAPSWAAFAAGVTAATFAVQAYRREGRRDRIAEDLRLREQSGKVGAWLVRVNTEEVTVHCLNLSDLPVTDVFVVIWGVEFDYETGTAGETVEQYERQFANWRPGYNQELKFSRSDKPPAPIADSFSEADDLRSESDGVVIRYVDRKLKWSIVCEFFDAQDLHWRRKDGRLRRGIISDAARAKYGPLLDDTGGEP